MANNNNNIPVFDPCRARFEELAQTAECQGRGVKFISVDCNRQLPVNLARADNKQDTLIYLSRGASVAAGNMNNGQQGCPNGVRMMQSLGSGGGANGGDSSSSGSTWDWVFWALLLVLGGLLLREWFTKRRRQDAVEQAVEDEVADALAQDGTVRGRSTLRRTMSVW